MHNEEGKLFDAVFHKLLALGVAIIAAAAVVWFIWAIVRTSAITHDASQPQAPAGAGSSMREAPDEARSLANARVTARDVRVTVPAEAAVPAHVGDPDKMIELFIRPMALLAARVNGQLDQLPRALARTTTDTAFFIGGP